MTINTSNTTLSYAGVAANKKEENRENTFAAQLGEKQEKSTQADEEITDDELRKRLTEDIFSVLRTGLTVAELKELEKLLEEFKKRVKEETPNAEKLAQMMQELEQKIAKLMKHSAKNTTEEANEISNTSTVSSEKKLMKMKTELKTTIEEATNLNKEAVTNNNKVRTAEELELLKKLQQEKSQPYLA